MTLDDKTRTELEAAAFRRLVEHLRARTDVHLLSWLLTRQKEGVERFYVPPRFDGTMRSVAASLLDDRRGLVTCPHCNQTFRAERIRREEWTGNPGGGGGPEGCRYFCPGEHLLLKVPVLKAS